MQLKNLDLKAWTRTMQYFIYVTCQVTQKVNTRSILSINEGKGRDRQKGRKTTGNVYTTGNNCQHGKTHAKGLGTGTIPHLTLTDFTAVSYRKKCQRCQTVNTGQLIQPH